MRKIPNRPKLFKGWTRSWYWDSVIDDVDSDETEDEDNTDDESGDSGDTGDSGDSGDSGDIGDTGDEGDSGDTGDEGDDTTVTVEVNGTTYSFSTEYETETATAAVSALESDIESEDEETVDAFEAVVGEDEVLSEYIGCYEVSAETGVLTLASPVEVTDPEVYTAIVLHYNDETGEWEQVSDVQIIDGYVYAVFESLSPVAVYLVKKKYVATVTIGDEVTQYETIAEAVAYAEENIASSTIIALTWNKSITETIGPLYTTSTGNLTFDLGGYTIYASVDGGAAINISGDACTTSLILQNGSIVCDDVTTCGVNIYDIYATLNEVNISTTCVGATALKIDGVKAYPTDCVITTENGYGVSLQGTDVAGLTSVIKTCTITTTNTDDNAYAPIYAPNVNDSAFLFSISDTTIVGDVYGAYNDSACGKVYLSGSTSVTAPTAVYISANNTISNGFYTSSVDFPYVNGVIVTDSTVDSQGLAIKYGYFTVAIADNWMASGYTAYTNDDETYITLCDITKVVECTTADGVVTYKNGLTSSAFTAAGSGGTVKMLMDYSATGLGPTTSGVTVDMDGHTFTVTGAGVYTSSTKGVEMTLKNGTIESTYTNSGACAVHCQIGTINLIDMNIITVDDGETNTNGVACGTTSKDYAATINISGSTTITAPTGVFIQNKTGATNVTTANISGDVIINARSYAVTGNGSYDGTVINIEGGTFNCTGDGAALYHPQAGTLTINGGEFTGVVTGIQICDGDVTINDATVTVTGEDDTANKTGDGNIPDAAALSVVNRSGYSSTYPTLAVKGGTFKSTNGDALKAYSWASNTMSDWDATGYVKVSGGNFSTVVDAAYIEEGYACSIEATDGLYTVSASE